MSVPLTRSDWNAAEKVDHIFQRIRTCLMTAEDPRIGDTLVKALALLSWENGRRQ